MFESKPSSVISINTEKNLIQFYSKSKTEKGAFVCDTETYNSGAFNDEFYEKFSRILKLYKESHPQINLDRVSLVLSNNAVCTDTVTIPVVRRTLINNSIFLAINSIYSNSEEMRFTSYLLSQSKQNLTYGIIGVRRELLSRLRRVCSENRISLSGISYSANTLVDGAFAVNPKIKNGSFILMNIGESSTDFSFVIKGKTVAFYTLPFGHSILDPNFVSSEDALFDHASADILVLNAKERARAKLLTMLTDSVESEDDEEAVTQSEDGSEDDTKSAVAESTESTECIESIESSPEAQLSETKATVGISRRGGKKLPKSMLRPIPNAGEDAICENFRLFIKWALDLINSNANLLSYGTVDTVYVNMPQKYDFLYSKVNEDKENNKVTFAPLISNHDRHVSILEHLELYGAMFLKQYNKINNF